MLQKPFSAGRSIRPLTPCRFPAPKRDGGRDWRRSRNFSLCLASRPEFGRSFGQRRSGCWCRSSPEPFAPVSAIGWQATSFAPLLQPRAPSLLERHPARLAEAGPPQAEVAAPGRHRGHQGQCAKNISPNVIFLTSGRRWNRLTCRRELKAFLTKRAAIAASLQFERSVQSGNKRLLRLCAPGTPGSTR
jgi:hypothetical protein